MTAIPSWVAHQSWGISILDAGRRACVARNLAEAFLTTYMARTAHRRCEEPIEMLRAVTPELLNKERRIRPAVSYFEKMEEHKTRVRFSPQDM